MDAHRPSEFELLRQGDRAVGERFVREHYAELYRWLYRLTGSRHNAEDLTQQSFAAFWGSLEKAAPHVAARTWLFSIARNQWRKECRRLGSSREQGEDQIDQFAGGDAEPPAASERRELTKVLNEAVSALAPEFREVFALRVWHEFSQVEIAEIQGISPELARWRFHRARALIRKRLTPWVQEEERCRDL